LDDYALINSCGFVKVVDAIGGITIDIDRKLPMPSKLRCSNYRLTPTIGPGETYMDGTKALGYVRSRTGDSDYQRMDRQRLLLQTIVDEIGIDDLLLRFGDLAAALKDNVSTSMSVEEARTMVATLQSGDQSFDSVGLAPPLVEPAHPDYAAIKVLMQKIRTALSNGTPLDLPTDTTG
ncbi:MAG: LCP family protein, partial [Ilumatobacteraceae bacterium]|nr:LCP family protein [Ilumatobacteraceae bacterium]